MTLPAKKTYQKFEEEKIQSEFVRNKLKLKNLEVKNSFDQKYPHVKKFFSDHGLDFSKIREHSSKVIATGALSGALLFTPPIMPKSLPNPTEIIKSLDQLSENSIPSDPIPKNEVLTAQMQNYLPGQVGPLTRSQEKNLEKIFLDTIGISARGTLEGEHLNTTYGLIGAEQHLIRYPGDTLSAHDLVPND